MARLREATLRLGQLNDLAEVHHGNPVAHVPHDAEVMGDEDQRQPKFALKILQQVDDLCLN